MFSLAQLAAQFFTRKSKSYDPHVRSLQDAYETIRNHFLTQKVRASEYGSCKYRTKDGLMCAIGCIIPDKDYDPMLEGSTIYQNNVLKTVQKVTGLDLYMDMDNEAFTFLGRAQRLHDSAIDGLIAVVPKLDALAEEYGLEIPRGA